MTPLEWIGRGDRHGLLRYQTVFPNFATEPRKSSTPVEVTHRISFNDGASLDLDVLAAAIYGYGGGDSKQVGEHKCRTWELETNDSAPLPAGHPLVGLSLFAAVMASRNLQVPAVTVSVLFVTTTSAAYAVLIAACAIATAAITIGIKGVD